MKNNFLILQTSKWIQRQKFAMYVVDYATYDASIVTLSIAQQSARLM